MTSRSSEKYADTTSSFSGSKRPKNSEDDDWAEIVNPEQRRRVQNRIAQRRLQRIRDQKEQCERRLRNHEHAGSVYRTPDPAELEARERAAVEYLQGGLPWGGPNMSHIVSRGYLYERSRGGARGGGGGGAGRRGFDEENDGEDDNDSIIHNLQHWIGGVDDSGSGHGSSGSSSDGISCSSSTLTARYHIVGGQAYIDYDDVDTVMSRGGFGSFAPLHEGSAGYVGDQCVVNGDFAGAGFELAATIVAGTSYTTSDDQGMYVSQPGYMCEYKHGYASSGGYVSGR